MIAELLTYILLKSIESLAVAGCLYFLYSLCRDVKNTFHR